MSSKLNVLSLTAGESFLEKNAAGKFNQQQLRQIEYAKKLGKYIIVARTSSLPGIEPLVLAPNLIVYPTNSKSRFLFMSDMIKLASRICAEQQIDVISPRDPFFFGRIGFKLKSKFNIPLAVHVMGDMIDNPYFFKERFGNRILNYFAKRLLKKADAIRVSTTREQEKLVRLGLLQEKVFRVPFFVDLIPFLNADGSAKRRELLQGKYDRIVLTVSRLSKEKNVTMLVRVAAKVAKKNNRILFVVIGDGVMMNELRSLAASIGAADNIVFTGRIENALLQEYYHSADVFAITSFYEGTCMVLLEAAASGLPVVSTDTAGAADAILKGETGYILPIDADEAFALVILDLLYDDRRKKMGEKGRQHVLASFDKDSIIKDCITLWEYAASRKSMKGE